MEAFFNRINEAGGIHGRKIKLIAYDHVYQPPKAVTNAKRLVERDHVFVMMGHLGTPTTKAIKDYLEERRCPTSSRPPLASIWTTSGKWHVGDLATYTDQTGLIVDYLVKEKKIRKIASFYQDDEYGLDGHLGGKARLKHSHDLDYVAEVDYKRADIDFSSQAAKLKESGAEAVILQAVYREPPRLAEQCHAIGYNPLFIGPSPIVLAKTIELGGKHVEGMMGVEVYPLPTEPGAFLDQYRADMAKYFPNLADRHDEPLRLPEGRAVRRGHAARRQEPHPRLRAQGDRVDQGLGPGLGPQVRLRRRQPPRHEQRRPSRHREGRQVGEGERLDGAQGNRPEVKPMIEILTSQVVSGLATGCVYALIALGFVLIFKATDVVNFAQGEFVMVSGFISYTLLIGLGVPYGLVLVATIVLSGFMGVILERVVVRPIMDAPIFSIVIATIGASIVLRSSAGILYGYDVPAAAHHLLEGPRPARLSPVHRDGRGRHRLARW